MSLQETPNGNGTGPHVSLPRRQGSSTPAARLTGRVCQGALLAVIVAAAWFFHPYAAALIAFIAILCIESQI